jgi:hypothetical protein
LLPWVYELLYTVLNWRIRHHWVTMPSFEVISVASTLAAATSIGLERAVPRIISLDIGYHVLGVIVPTETVSAILLPILAIINVTAYVHRHTL